MSRWKNAGDHDAITVQDEDRCLVQHGGELTNLEKNRNCVALGKFDKEYFLLDRTLGNKQIKVTLLPARMQARLAKASSINSKDKLVRE